MRMAVLPFVHTPKMALLAHSGAAGKAAALVFDGMSGFLEPGLWQDWVPSYGALRGDLKVVEIWSARRKAGLFRHQGSSQRGRGRTNDHHAVEVRLFHLVNATPLCVGGW